MFVSSLLAFLLVLSAFSCGYAFALYKENRRLRARDKRLTKYCTDLVKYLGYRVTNIVEKLK